MITYNVIINEEIVDTITVSDINTLDGYELPSVQCELRKVE